MDYFEAAMDGLNTSFYVHPSDQSAWWMVRVWHV